MLLSRRGPRAAIAIGAAVLAALALQLAAPPNPAVSLLAPVAFAVVAFMLARGPHWCVGMIVAATVLGLYQESVALGPIDVRATDVPMVALILWALLLRNEIPRPTDIGQRHIGLFLAVCAFSLFPVLVLGRSGFLPSLVSLARLVITWALVWLVPVAMSPSRRRVTFTILLALLATAVAHALLTSAERAEGFVGPNQIGLYAAILLLSSLHAPYPRPRAARVTFGVLGVLGLVGAQSVGSIVATAVALGLFGVRERRAANQRGASPLVTPLRFAVFFVVALGVVSAVKPVNLPGSLDFWYSSSAHRFVVASAGIELFEENPVFGVGWQRSARSDVIAAPDINRDLRERFPQAQPEFFPDERPTTVHNAYLQVLADTGLVGATAAVLAIVVVRRKVRRLVDGLSEDPEKQLAGAMVIVLAITLVWWNDNPLYGSEPETTFTALMLGMLASLRLPAAGADEPASEPLRSHVVARRGPVPESRLPRW